MENKEKKENKKILLIIIGSEILSGRTADLNGQNVAKICQQFGQSLKQIITIADNKSEMLEALRFGVMNFDLVITSGGLGPTRDDLTKNVLSEFFQKPIEIREDVLKIVEDNYSRFQRKLDVNLNFYHHFPKDFIPLKNPTGLAPGIWYDKVISGPGVPHELSAMLSTVAFPLIFTHYEKNITTIIRTKGIPEEKIFGELAVNLWDQLSVFGNVASLPHLIGVDITVQSEKQIAIQELVENSPLAPYVWSYSHQPIEEQLIELCQNQKLKIGAAESCTGGFLSHRLTNIAGASEVFLGSIISYANEIKENNLQVRPETLHAYGAVSEECAIEMAEGVLKSLNLNASVSLTGIAGPGGGSEAKPVGLICIAVAIQNKKTKSFTYQFKNGTRLRNKERFSEVALYHLLSELK